LAWAVLGSTLAALAGCASHVETPLETPASGATAPVASPVSAQNRLLMTYYFYWYDAQTGGHLQAGSGLRYHPSPDPPPSWRTIAWHQRQFSDMSGAGIDVALADYWGFDNKDDEWSYKGLDVMAKAGQGLRDQGKRSPGIGMFFDTTIIRWRDLTKPDGKAYFYANFRDFFTRIPKSQWAVVNGRPIAFLFTSDWTTAVDQSSFDYVYSHFEKDFGVRPYIVREVSWDYPILRWQNGERIRDYTHPIHTDNNYLWAAAAHGYIDRGGVAAIGPGYDDHLVPGRGAGTITDRQDGSFYRRNFEKAIASGKPLLAIETWNEFHEGSGICETLEYGRKYIDLTRTLSAAFHARKN
jgi:hypothetical protein